MLTGPQLICNLPIALNLPAYVHTLYKKVKKLSLAGNKLNYWGRENRSPFLTVYCLYCTGFIQTDLVLRPSVLSHASLVSPPLKKRQNRGYAT